MPNDRRRKKPLRIRTELSQQPWNLSPKGAKQNAYTRGLKTRIHELEQQIAALSTGNTIIPMLLWCPGCGRRHIDEGVFATKEHRDHACQACGLVWRPSLVPTCGVQFLPGYRNETPAKGKKS